MKLHNSIFAILIISSQNILAQRSIHEKAYAKDNHIKSKTGWSVTYYEGGPSLPFENGYIEYDKNGNVIKVIEKWKKGTRLYKVKNFSYDKNERLNKAATSYVFDGFKEAELQLAFDENGRVIKKEFQRPVEGYWHEETIKYDKNGNVLEIAWWNEDGTQSEGTHKMTFEYERGKIVREVSHKPGDSLFVTVEYFYAPDGRHIESQFYGYGEEQKRYMITTYKYEYY